MRISCVCFLVILLTTACSPVKVQTDVKSTTDFSDMRTFGWLETSAASGDDVRVNNPELAVIVRAATEKSLQAKGFIKDGKPDFLVNWLGAIEEKIKEESIQHFYSGYGYGTLSEKGPGRNKEGSLVGSHEEGTIVIDILDPQKHVVLWRGKGTRQLTKGMDEAQVVRYINLSVDEILKSFPVSSR